MSDNVVRVSHWEELFVNPAWKELESVLGAQLQDRVAAILTYDLTPETIYTFERVRGERVGIELALVTALTMYEQAKADRETAKKESTNGTETPTV
jgi:hypothetical protein